MTNFNHPISFLRTIIGLASKYHYKLHVYNMVCLKTTNKYLPNPDANKKSKNDKSKNGRMRTCIIEQTEDEVMIIKLDSDSQFQKGCF